MGLCLFMYVIPKYVELQKITFFNWSKIVVPFNDKVLVTNYIEVENLTVEVGESQPSYSLDGSVQKNLYMMYIFGN